MKPWLGPASKFEFATVRASMVFQCHSYGDNARPDLPRPRCQVRLICGAPASGKSTYVAKRAGRSDIVLDLDAIAREYGMGRVRDDVGEMLQERNRRLAALANEPPERIAWVILSAPGPSLRRWWCDALGVKPSDLIVMRASRKELLRRVRNDPDRAGTQIQQLHVTLIDRWLEREREDDPGPLKRGCDSNGMPLDPLHPWNREHGG